MRSGAPSTASDATEPANMPNSKSRSAAMRAETASCTDAGCTHALPARIPRKRVRRELQRDGIVILPDDGDRDAGRSWLDGARWGGPYYLSSQTLAKS